MSDSERIDKQVRLAVEALPEAPVRWDRVARRARRRRRVALVMLVIVGLAFTVILTTGLLVSKSAIDPSFSPPLVSHSSVSADFDEPAFGHGLTALSQFRPGFRHFKREGDGLDPGTLGYVFKASLTGEVDEAERLAARWRIRHRGDSEALPLDMVPSAKGMAEDASGNEVFEVWIERPPRAGQFVVDFSAVSPGGVEAGDTSSPLHVIARGFLHQYSTTTYVAGIPEGWHVDSDYDPEPGHRFVTRLEGPHQMSVLVDTTPEVSGDPADSATGLEDLLENGEEPYKRLSFVRRNLGGPAFEWCFELGDHVSTDIFFYREGDGYAVLAESPESRFREARLVARVVARSVRGRTS